MSNQRCTFDIFLGFKSSYTAEWRDVSVHYSRVSPVMGDLEVTNWQPRIQRGADNVYRLFQMVLVTILGLVLISKLAKLKKKLRF